MAKNAEEAARWGHDLHSLEEHDDLSSEWTAVREAGELWGGRRRGGRGVKCFVNTDFVSIESVSLGFPGKELLVNSRLKLYPGRKYGLVGDNGVGKSTLLRCMARGSIPESSMEAALDALDVSNEDAISELADQLCALTDEIEALEKQRGTALDVDPTPKEVRSVIKGLGLSTPVERLSQSMDKLSGGWRMRASLAHALVDINNTDILLLDEPTNHLDIQTVRWLTELLQSLECIVVLVSHDRSFLDAVVSDIIEFKSQSLVHFPGSYEEWQQNREEMASRHNNMADAQNRKEEHIKKSISMAKARGDDATVKSKGKKLERASMHQRLDGKKFKLFTLPKLDASSIIFPERIASIKANKELRFKFPDPDMAGLRLLSTGGGPVVTSTQNPSTSTTASSGRDVFSSPLITLESCSITWMAAKNANSTNSTKAAANKVEKHTVLKDLTLQIFPGSRLAIVGANGSGVTSLPSAKKVIKYEDNNSDTNSDEDTQKTSKATSTSSVTQVPEIHLWESEIPGVKDIRDEKGQLIDSAIFRDFTNNTAAGCSLANNSFSILEARAHLGKFGLSGDSTLQPIESLSGGQKARLCLAAVMLNKPHAATEVQQVRL
eukprot:gene30769-38031_t